MRKLTMIPFISVLAALPLAGSSSAAGAADGQMVRLAKLVIDSAHLDEYKAALEKEAKASVAVELGVLTLYAVSEKAQPTHFTILEIYASRAAYEAHITTPHFLEYKKATEHMVQSLELIDSVPLVPGMKIK